MCVLMDRSGRPSRLPLRHRAPAARAAAAAPRGARPLAEEPRGPAGGLPANQAGGPGGVACQATAAGQRGPPVIWEPARAVRGRDCRLARTRAHYTPHTHEGS